MNSSALLKAPLLLRIPVVVGQGWRRCLNRCWWAVVRNKGERGTEEHGPGRDLSSGNPGDTSSNVHAWKFPSSADYWTWNYENTSFFIRLNRNRCTAHKSRSLFFSSINLLTKTVVCQSKTLTLTPMLLCKRSDALYLPYTTSFATQVDLFCLAL